MIVDMIDPGLIYVRTDDEKRALAIIIQSSFRSSIPTNFFTDPTVSLQIGHIHRPAGEIIEMHRHNQLERDDVTFPVEIHEALLVRTGMVTVTLKDEKRNEARFCLKEGDVAFLCGADHALLFHDESDIIEIKTGPHLADSKEFL